MKQQRMIHFAIVIAFALFLRFFTGLYWPQYEIAANVVLIVNVVSMVLAESVINGIHWPRH
jgi:hypothetical protein